MLAAQLLGFAQATRGERSIKQFGEAHILLTSCSSRAKAHSLLKITETISILGGLNKAARAGS
jgi:hypothetical protein